MGYRPTVHSGSSLAHALDVAGYQFDGSDIFAVANELGHAGKLKNYYNSGSDYVCALFELLADFSATWAETDLEEKFSGLTFSVKNKTHGFVLIAEFRVHPDSSNSSSWFDDETINKVFSVSIPFTVGVECEGFFMVSNLSSGDFFDDFWTLLSESLLIKKVVS